MNTLLFGVTLSALFSVTSLIVVLVRVSPLLSPSQALPAFFLSLFLSVSTLSTLGLLALWKTTPVHSWDMGKVMSISLRQGIFIGTGTLTLVLFHLFDLLNWWIAIMIYSVFLLIELALDH